MDIYVMSSILKWPLSLNFQQKLFVEVPPREFSLDFSR